MAKPMGIKYFFSLYWRNVKGSFTKPYNFALRLHKAGGVIIIGHTALLPVTLTLGAMTKTLIDFFTRKAISTNVLSERKNQINNLNQEKIEKLIQEVLLYKAMSNSSKRLQNEFRKLPGDMTQEQQEHHEAKKYALAVEQLGVPEGTSAETIYQKDYICTLQLNEEQQNKLTHFDNEDNKILAEKSLIKKKQIITDYMSSENNNGKKMLQTIVGFFTQSNEQINEYPSDAANIKTL